MPLDPKSVRLNDVLVGGQPVGYDIPAGILSIAGEEFTVDRWLETRRRIDMILKRTLSPEDWKALREKLAWLGKRDRLPQELRDYEQPASHAASSFLTRNLDIINSLDGGRLKKAPWWLRRFFPLVVAKEGHGNH